MTRDEAIQLLRIHNLTCDDYYRSDTGVARRRVIESNKELLEALTGQEFSDVDAEAVIP